jgi:hypothetical protein
MTNGFYKKKAMSDSRFAVLYEDPDYEVETDWVDDEDGCGPDLFVAEKPQEEYSPFITMNS